MSHLRASYDNLFVVRWGEPQPQDAKDVIAAVRTQRRACDRPIAYLAIMSENAPNLSEDARTLLMDLTTEVLPSCEKLVVVVEAEGFKAAILRSAMSALTLVSNRRGKVHFVDSVETGLTRLTDCLPHDRRQVDLALDRVSARDPINAWRDAAGE